MHFPLDCELLSGTITKNRDVLPKGEFNCRLSSLRFKNGLVKTAAQLLRFGKQTKNMLLVSVFEKTDQNIGPKLS